MRIFIEIPTWLGDAVMTTPALENLARRYPEARWTLFGSAVSLSALKAHPKVERIIEDTSRQKGNRWLNLRRLAKEAGAFDLALSFRRNATTKWLLFWLDAPQKGHYRRLNTQSEHQVIRYNGWLTRFLGFDARPGALKLYHTPKTYERPTLGINPGATYGSAKRWYPERFAEVAAALSGRYDILIFGGPAEIEMARAIEEKLKEAGIKNFQNLAGRTSVEALIAHIGGLNLFMTNDSGPMHIAAAYRVPTVALFGPTNHVETCQWQNPKSVIVRHEMPCAPCMKRVCPLKHHECMQAITPKEVIEAAKRLEA